MVASPESIVNGVIVVDGERFDVAIRSEFLFVDALSWFEHQRKRHSELAEQGLEEGDEEFAAEMRGVADQVAELMRAGRPLEQPGIWPGIRNRSVVSPWCVEAEPAAMRSYLRCLVEIGVSGESDGPIFLLRCGGGSGEFIATERLKAQIRFAHPFEAKLVKAEEIQRRLAEPT